MQSYKFDDVIDRACERKQLDKEMMKSISDFVFIETKKEMGRFNNLRVFVEGLMTFFYGKKRLIEFKEKMNRTDGRYKPSFLNSKSTEEIEELKVKVDNLLNVYEVYIQDKRTTKQNYKESKIKNEPTTKVQGMEKFTK